MSFSGYKRPTGAGSKVRDADWDPSQLTETVCFCFSVGAVVLNLMTELAQSKYSFGLKLALELENWQLDAGVPSDFVTETTVPLT